MSISSFASLRLSSRPAVRGRTVPVGIAAALAHDEAVAHIERYDELLALDSGHGTFAYHTHREVDIVVRGYNLLGNLARHARHAAQHVENQTLEHNMVILGVSLGYDHVGDIRALHRRRGSR